VVLGTPSPCPDAVRLIIPTVGEPNTRTTRSLKDALRSVQVDNPWRQPFRSYIHEGKGLDLEDPKHDPGHCGVGGEAFCSDLMSIRDAERHRTVTHFLASRLLVAGHPTWARLAI
jgi:hypothetical protein